MIKELENLKELLASNVYETFCLGLELLKTNPDLQTQELKEFLEYKHYNYSYKTPKPIIEAIEWFNLNNFYGLCLNEYSFVEKKYELPLWKEIVDLEEGLAYVLEEDFIRKQFDAEVFEEKEESWTIENVKRDVAKHRKLLWYFYQLIYHPKSFEPYYKNNIALLGYVHYLMGRFLLERTAFVGGLLVGYGGVFKQFMVQLKVWGWKKDTQTFYQYSASEEHIKVFRVPDYYKRLVVKKTSSLKKVIRMLKESSIFWKREIFMLAVNKAEQLIEKGELTDRESNIEMLEGVLKHSNNMWQILYSMRKENSDLAKELLGDRDKEEIAAAYQEEENIYKRLINKIESTLNQ
ncbi:MAG: hypothetical protein GY810_13455 [Aureispira sp.]|nr:hypothetical protein [Aureispira sp.]